MNINNLHQIFQKYIDSFEYLNNKEHDENYKWEVAQGFQNFDLDADDFVAEMKRLLKISCNLIDSGQSMPFAGLIEFAKKEPITVKKMFEELYANENNDLELKQRKIDSFINQSEELRKKYFKDSHLYINNQRSAMQFLFLRYPDSNYMYKASQAKSFADCIEFYDDWGPMSDFKIEVYYRMCDQLVKEIKKFPAIVETHKSRFEHNKKKLYIDKELHILAFDIIYSSQVYDFYKGMEFSPIKAQARKLHEERVLKAKVYYNDLKIAKENYDILNNINDFLYQTFCVGAKIKHKFYKNGTIKEINDKNIITVDFNGSEKRLGLNTLITSNLLVIESDDLKEKFESIKPVLLKSDSIPRALSFAEKNFESYAEYFEE